jgi:D-glycero-alpha-D-manno-heptose-7-phosphate kinase
VSLAYRPEDTLIYDGKLDLVKAALLKMDYSALGGFDLYLRSNAPPGSGLGSSSAMMVALVGVLKELKNIPLTDYEVADLAYIIERKDLGIQGGLQDQYAASFGGINYIEFLSDRVIVNPLKVSSDIVNELNYNLLLCYTGTMRLSASIIEDQVQRYERREQASLDALREIKCLTVEMKNMLLQRRLSEFGSLLHEEWMLKKSLASRISNDRLDSIYSIARDHGAIGGKVTGAGGGGFMLLYCDFERKHDVAEAMKDVGCTVVDFQIEPQGLQTWRTPHD